MNIPMPHHSTSRLRCALLGAFYLLTALAVHAGSPPVITDVTASQRAGTKLVDIAYKISDPDSTAVNIGILVSKDSGNTWTVPASPVNMTGTGVPGFNIAVIATPTVKNVVWNAGADWDGHYTANCRVRIIASDNGTAVIPAGTFTMGDQSGDGIP